VVIAGKVPKNKLAKSMVVGKRVNLYIYFYIYVNVLNEILV